MTAFPYQLRFKNNKPVFVAGEKVGYVLRLFFGNVWVGDYSRFVVCYEIALKPDRSAKEVASLNIIYDYHDARPSQINYYLEQKPKVVELVEKIYAACQQRQYLDLSEILAGWKQWDEDFGVDINRK